MQVLDVETSPAGVRYRLTLVGTAVERQFPSDVLLSRSRFIAPASHSLRFYREYFKPESEVDIEKTRLRWRVLFQRTEFYINVDNIQKPSMGYFLELKSRTWSRQDAEWKAQLVLELSQFLNLSGEGTITVDYLELVKSS